MESTQRLLRSCLQPQGGTGMARRGGAVQRLVERLQAAYADIWQLKLLQGLEKLKVLLPKDAMQPVTCHQSLRSSDAAHSESLQIKRLQAQGVCTVSYGVKHPYAFERWHHWLA